jgi:hypothetical protein
MRFVALAFAATLAALPAAAIEGHGDLRGGVSVGMSVADLPETGYKEFVCLAPKGKTLQGFADYKACEPDGDHLHAMRVEIDEPGQDDTLVAGHPVDLTLGFDDEGRLARIVILTKRKGPLFVRKKAFLLGLQARARYGDQGWNCQESPLGADEEALGPTSVKEHCVKSDGERRITVDRALYRKTGSDAKAFVSESRVTIDWAKS